MAQDDPLAIGGKNHVMLAHDIAPAHGRKADMAPLARASDPIAAPVRDRVQIHAAPRRRRFAQHQGGARWRVDLVAVMRLDDLDVEIGIQRGGDLLGQLDQQVHPKAGISGPHGDAMARGGEQLLDMRGFKAGGADDMHRAGLRGKFGEFHTGLGAGEIQHALRLCKGCDRIIADSDTNRLPAQHGADILSDPRAAHPHQRAHKAAFA
ncbi:predicted signal transduction protein containing a membrane domain protein [Ketogulonicigenium vulgare WSH-001]|uniref:Predicted signal transduction protein containing a membrane domain protein n=1 Tax=Ketogulonicigenium vulgare (strain WSH-001) TaxID=759362 RepID=F9Y6P5_KETVW|nr:predicted signal transduction protein containing a membrane domain protein [Ketogulonicigenium vulgare WSH-001]